MVSASVAVSAIGVAGSMMGAAVSCSTAETAGVSAAGTWVVRALDLRRDVAAEAPGDTTRSFSEVRFGFIRFLRSPNFGLFPPILAELT